MILFIGVVSVVLRYDEIWNIPVSDFKTIPKVPEHLHIKHIYLKEIYFISSKINN